MPGAPLAPQVYEATWNETTVAVKVLAGMDVGAGSGTGTGGGGSTGLSGRQLTLSSPQLASLRAECRMMARLRHPHVVQLLGMCASPPAIVTGELSWRRLRGTLH